VSPIILLLTLSLAFLLLAWWLASRARRSQKLSGLPKGRLVYADTAHWSAVTQPYFSSRHRLTGKPDYLVDTPHGLVPVEVKNTTAPSDGQAYESHVMQLAAYCLLVEEASSYPPPYGLIHYRDATIRIDYTPTLRQALLSLLDDMRRQLHASDMRRSHDDPARCRACGVRHACGSQALST
jgi:CRISPR-associated exonuclease Cas4